MLHGAWPPPSQHESLNYCPVTGESGVARQLNHVQFAPRWKNTTLVHSSRRHKRLLFKHAVVKRINKFKKKRSDCARGNVICFNLLFSWCNLPNEQRQDKKVWVSHFEGIRDNRLAEALEMEKKNQVSIETSTVQTPAALRRSRKEGKKNSVHPKPQKVMQFICSPNLQQPHQWSLQTLQITMQAMKNLYLTNTTKHLNGASTTSKLHKPLGLLETRRHTRSSDDPVGNQPQDRWCQDTHTHCWRQLDVACFSINYFNSTKLQHYPKCLTSPSRYLLSLLKDEPHLTAPTRNAKWRAENNNKLWHRTITLIAFTSN